MEITLGIMTVIIAVLIFALYKSNEIRKVHTETLLKISEWKFTYKRI